MPAKPMKPAAATAVGAAPDPLLVDDPPAPPAAVVVAAPLPEPLVEELPDPEDCHAHQR